MIIELNGPGKLRAGEIILSGSLGAMLPVVAGDSFHLSIGGVGSASIRFT